MQAAGRYLRDFALGCSPHVPRKSLRPHLNQIRTWTRQGRTDAWVAHQLDVTVQQIGDSLMHRYVLPLEIMGLLLTAALIGAVVIAMDRIEEPK